MVEFRVMIIEYKKEGIADPDFKVMKQKVKDLKEVLLGGPLVIFDDQITVETNKEKGYIVVIINEVPDAYIRKVFKRLKTINPYNIRISWYGK